MIFEGTYNFIKRNYSERIKDLVIEDAKIGLYLTAVRLSDNSVGTSVTLPNELPRSSKNNRDFGAFSPLKIQGQSVSSILGSDKNSGLISSLKVAVLSAVSSRIIETGNYHVIPGLDPIQLLDLKPGITVAIVGAIQSYIREVSKAGCRLTVLEKNPDCLFDGQEKYYMAAREYEKILPHSDIIIITGQTIVNGTIDELLAVANPSALVVVTGPSCNIIPDILFDMKVSIVGAIRILDPLLLFDLVGEGGTSYHLFEYSAATKICIINGNGTTS